MRTRSSRSLIRSMVVALATAATAMSHAGSWVGDAGHFLCHTPDVYANNPEGRAFTVTVHRHVWPADWGNGPRDSAYECRVLAPDGTVVAEGRIPWGEEQVRLEVPAGVPGVYRVAWKGAGYALTWVECSLDQLVVGMGDWDMKEGPYKTFILHVMAPRRWYFHVPRGLVRFEVKHTVFPFQSHREDYGFLVLNPRGQRVEAIYGGKPLEVETRKPNETYAVARTVETDPGTSGRFWSIWATGGDGHSFSDLSIMVGRDVPPFFASAPEQWFDPRTGQGAPPLVYDDDPVRVRDQKDEDGQVRSRDHYLLTPTPYLGDEDYNGWRGRHTLFYANPENRPLDLGVVTYIADDAARFPAHLRLVGPDGKLVLAADGEFGHRRSWRQALPAAGAGVYRAEIDAARWFPWMEPAVPVVMAAQRVAAGPDHFQLELGIARHWFFTVPRGTREFTVGATVRSPQHVLHLEVHAPDRMLDLLYVPGGEPRRARILVPPGLDGCIWFLRTEVGSATRYLSAAGVPAHNRIEADISLEGVPAFLAPTWEQFFLPRP
jgi:hypothetical protein